MGTWILMLFICMLIPAVMLLAGWFLKSTPPTDINAFLGYRTKRSMASQEAWDFAQKYAGRCWIRWSGWVLAASLAVMLALLGRGEDAAAIGGNALMLAQLVPLLAVIPVTEKVLKEKFGDGTGKST